MTHGGADGIHLGSGDVHQGLGLCFCGEMGRELLEFDGRGAVFQKRDDTTAAGIAQSALYSIIGPETPLLLHTKLGLLT